MLSVDENIVSAFNTLMATIYLNLPRTMQIALDGFRLMFSSMLLSISMQDDILSLVFSLQLEYLQ